MMPFDRDDQIRPAGGGHGRAPAATPLGRRRAPPAHAVAALAGVSQSVVSRAFTDGASISAAAREKVRAAAAELGYRPNLIARSLITRRSNLIGVAMSYMDNQFYPSILEAMSAGFHARGYRLVLFTPGAGGEADPVLDEILRFGVDAVILASARVTSQFAQCCARAHVPVVLLNRRTPSTAVSSVTGDNESGGRAVAEFLLAGNHRRFAFLAGLEDASTSRERERGFMTRLREADVSTPLRASGAYAFEAARVATRQLLSGRDAPDALFCANDHMAMAAIETARTEFGRRIGHDLSVVGFDDVGPAAWPCFDLTTFTQPVAAMAERVVAVTLGHLGEARYVPVQVTVPGRLLVRGSARRPT